MNTDIMEAQVRQMQALHNECQVLLNELQEMEKRACEGLISRTEEAYNLYQKAFDKANVYICKTNECQRLNETFVKQEGIETRASLLWGMGQAALLLGKFNKAREVFEQGLSLFQGQRNFQNALFLDSLGSVFHKMGLFLDAKKRYHDAYQEYTALEEWELASNMLSSLADCAISQGKYAEFLHLMDEAIEFTKAHQLVNVIKQLERKYLRYQMDLDPTGEEALIKLDNKGRQTASLNDYDLKILTAEYWAARNSYKEATDWLLDARQLVQGEPYKLCMLLQKLANTYGFVPELDKAIMYADEAYQIAHTLQQPALIGSILRDLIPLLIMKNESGLKKRADDLMDELRKINLVNVLTQILLKRSFLYNQQKDFELALKDVEEAERYASTLDLRLHVLGTRTMILQSMGRIEESLKANQQAIELLSEQDIPEGEPSQASWVSHLSMIEALQGNAALMLTQLGRVNEAFEFAEKGRSRILRGRLAQAGITTGDKIIQKDYVTLDELDTLLSLDNAAMVMYWVGSRKTLALIIDPSTITPKYTIISLGEEELKNIFTENTEVLSNEILKQLSDKLLPPEICKVIRQCKILYFIPYSYLYSVPFGALYLDDGSQIIDNCAVCYMPSASLLKCFHSRQSNSIGHACLAFGAQGSVNYSFTDLAKEIEGLDWERSELLPETATAKQFLEKAPLFSVLHLSCHGVVEHLPSTLSASKIKFDNEDLSAKDIFEYEGRLNADLIFLNTCYSGKFNIRMGSEVGGFWQAFLSAGATSIIATLNKVDPHYAQALALKFYDVWLKGDITKAEALRQAQLYIREQNKEIENWASHILVGYHR